ncbi:MAG: efflux RND transporter periplasmic adaptor subunit [Methylacidiphilales bacterium]|nr:efflux RND transporter periplasmic adaptor subunit [Candidatus Methylacidiphilales bacterium]
MAKEVIENKFSQPAPIAPHTNGTAASPRIPLGRPEQRRSRSGLWLVLLLIVLAVVAAGLYFYHQKTQSTASAGEAGRHGGAGDKIRVVTATATRGDIGVYLRGLGAVTPVNVDTIQSRVNGQIMKIDFTEGQMVKAGDPLLQIDTRPYDVQLEQYIAQKEHDQALLDNANVDLQRYQTLWKQDSIPQQTLATQEYLVKQDQGTVDSDQALIDATRLNITYCNITAPISGRVGLRLVDVGNYVQSTSSSGLLVITQLQPITVVFTIAEDDVPAVMAKINAGRQLTVEAFDRSASVQDMADHKKWLATGTLLTADNQIDPTTGTLKFKAVFQNGDNALFPNQFVNALLLVDTKKNVVIVPIAAIQYNAQNSSFVYVVDDSDPHNATVSMKNVTVGTKDLIGNNAEIQSGLDEGDIVVIDGVDKLQDGSKVIISTGADTKKQGGATADAASAPSS